MQLDLALQQYCDLLELCGELDGQIMPSVFEEEENHCLDEIKGQLSSASCL